MDRTFEPQWSEDQRESGYALWKKAHPRVGRLGSPGQARRNRSAGPPTEQPLWEAGVKKLINSVDDFVKESLEGMQVAQGSLASTTTRSWCTGRTRRCRARSASSPAAGPGTSPCTAGSWARGCWTPPARGVHLADAGPDGVGDQEGRQRGRGAPHRQELLRRRDELRDGGRPGPRRRGRGRAWSWTTTWPSRTPSTPRAARGRRDRADGEDRRGQGRGGADLASVAELARDVNANVRSMGLALTSCTVPAAGRPPSSWATTRSRSASASTASRDASGSRWRAPTSSPTG